MDEPTIKNDPSDLNYAPEDDPHQANTVYDTVEGGDADDLAVMPLVRRQTSVGKKLLAKSEFNVQIKEALDDCLNNPNEFVNRILEMDQKSVHSGVFRLLLMT